MRCHVWQRIIDLLPSYISHAPNCTQIQPQLQLRAYSKMAMASADLVPSLSHCHLHTFFHLHHRGQPPRDGRPGVPTLPVPLPAAAAPPDPAQLKECQQRCEERRRETEGGGGEGGEHEKHQREQLERCKQECRREHGEQEVVKVCEQQCEERFHGGGRNQDKEEEQGREGRSYPYTFGEERLKERVRTEDGRVRVTPRFGPLSELFRGIDNYRVALLEANPNSLVDPNHYDAVV